MSNLATGTNTRTTPTPNPDIFLTIANDNSIDESPPARRTTTLYFGHLTIPDFGPLPPSLSPLTAHEAATLTRNTNPSASNTKTHDHGIEAVKLQFSWLGGPFGPFLPVGTGPIEAPKRAFERVLTSNFDEWVLSHFQLDSTAVEGETGQGTTSSGTDERSSSARPRPIPAESLKLLQSTLKSLTCAKWPLIRSTSHTSSTHPGTGPYATLKTMSTLLMKPSWHSKKATGNLSTFSSSYNNEVGAVLERLKMGQEMDDGLREVRRLVRDWNGFEAVSDRVKKKRRESDGAFSVGSGEFEFRFGFEFGSEGGSDVGRGSSPASASAEVGGPFAASSRARLGPAFGGGQRNRGGSGSSIDSSARDGSLGSASVSTTGSNPKGKSKSKRQTGTHTLNRKSAQPDLAIQARLRAEFDARQSLIDTIIESGTSPTELRQSLLRTYSRCLFHFGFDLIESYGLHYHTKATKSFIHNNSLLPTRNLRTLRDTDPKLHLALFGAEAAFRVEQGKSLKSLTASMMDLLKTEHIEDGKWSYLLDRINDQDGTVVDNTQEFKDGTEVLGHLADLGLFEQQTGGIALIQASKEMNKLCKSKTEYEWETDGNWDDIVERGVGRERKRMASELAKAKIPTTDAAADAGGESVAGRTTRGSV